MLATRSWAVSDGYRTNSGRCQRLHGQVERAALEVNSRGVWELPYVGKALQQQPLLKGCAEL